jgi:hypothetical protein
MVEATPREPFTGYAADLLRVERNMRLRRKRMLSVLAPDEIAPTVTCLPTMGVGSDFCRPPFPLGGAVADSAYVPDGIINSHPRFAALTANIRARRGSHVDIQLPIFRDTKTPEYAAHPPPLLTPASSPVVVLTKASFGGVRKAAAAVAAAEHAAEEVVKSVPQSVPQSMPQSVPSPPAPPSLSDRANSDRGLTDGFVWQLDADGNADSSAGDATNSTNSSSTDDHSAAAAQIKQLVNGAAAAAATLHSSNQQQQQQQPKQRITELPVADFDDTAAATTATAGADSDQDELSQSPQLLPGLRLVGRSGDVPLPPPTTPGGIPGGRPAAPAGSTTDCSNVLNLYSAE